MLASLSGTNYTITEHEHLEKYNPYAIPSENQFLNAHEHLFKSWNFGGSAFDTYRVIVFRNSSGTNYVLNEKDDLGQSGPYAIPSEILQFDESAWTPFVSMTSSGIVTHIYIEYND